MNSPEIPDSCECDQLPLKMRIYAKISWAWWQ